MNEIIKLLVGIFVLLIGFPIGSYLAKKTKEELKTGQKWFRLIIISGLIIGVAGLIFRNDVLLFTGFFIAIVVSKCLRK